jgi:DNA (cytosine-5)-methyltransferase 1
LQAQQPQVFTLENVWQYRTFAAFRLICDTLGHMGYFWTYDHVNAADFGVPQTRRRLILRASRGLLPFLPQPVPWVGWYAAIEDLLPTLPESKLAPWQLARLPEELRGSVLVGGGNTQLAQVDSKARLLDEPAFTVTGNTKMGDNRAVLINESSTMEIRTAQEPCAVQVSSERTANQKAILK